MVLVAPGGAAPPPPRAEAHFLATVGPGAVPSPQSGLAVPRPNATNGTVDVGLSTTFSAAPTGGVPPYSYRWAGLPAGCATANASTLACSPATAGVDGVWVAVTDSHATVADSPMLNVTVNPRVHIINFNVSAPSVTVGANLTFVVVADGGSAPLTYAYTGLPQGCAVANTPTIDCQPTTVGNYLVLVTVIDRLGERDMTSENVAVTGHSLGGGGPPPAVVTLQSYYPLIAVVVVVAAVIVTVVFLGRRRGPPST